MQACCAHAHTVHCNSIQTSRQLANYLANNLASYIASQLGSYLLVGQLATSSLASQLASQLASWLPSDLILQLEDVCLSLHLNCSLFKCLKASSTPLPQVYIPLIDCVNSDEGTVPPSLQESASINFVSASKLSSRQP